MKKGLLAFYFEDEAAFEQDGVHFVTLAGQETKSCSLEFKPSEVCDVF